MYELQFYTLTNLQGSQTKTLKQGKSLGFTLLQTYKVLKQKFRHNRPICCFTLLQTYKVLKPLGWHYKRDYSFTLLQTYKVLKQLYFDNKSIISFTLLQTYKVLKHELGSSNNTSVLHSYKLTRFSNLKWVKKQFGKFYTLTNLQGSQTITSMFVA